MTGQTFWDQLLGRIEPKVNRHSFLTWFKPATFVRDEGTALVVRVPNAVFRDWLMRHYAGVMDETLAELGRPGCTVTLVTEDAPDLGAAETALSEGFAAEAGSTGAEFADAVPGEAVHLAGLNPRYTFDTFVVGPSNQFAQAACRAVAETPSRSYNPLYIYGGVGLGKTHLMHAIGHYVLRNSPDMKLTYISAERFMNEMINALHDSAKQIVISSDCPPHEIPQLEERLRSRFKWGLIADIQPPDIETKVAILRRKADAEAVPLPDNVAVYIASKIRSNIRELEGSLIRLVAYASLRGADITLPLAQDVLSGILTTDERAVTVEIIQKFVADFYQLKMSELKSRNNSKSIALPRQVAMYLCKSLTNASLPEIGRAFAGKHHSTVLHSVRKIEEMRKHDADFNSLINTLLDNFR